MTILLAGLDPKQSLTSVENLRLIAHPRWSGKKHIALEYIEEGEKKRFGSRCNDDLISVDL